MIDSPILDTDDKSSIRTVNSSDKGDYDDDSNDSKKLWDMQKSFAKLDVTTICSEQGNHQPATIATKINNERNSGVGSLLPDCPLSVSFVRLLAERAHGMVGCDLLQAVKEAFFISLNRDIQRNILRNKSDVIAADVSEYDRNLTRSGICNSIKIGRKEANSPHGLIEVTSKNGRKGINPIARMNDGTHKICSASSHGNEKRISFDDEVGMESDTSYRPMNLISDYDSEEEDGDGDGDGDDAKISSGEVDMEEQGQIITSSEDRKVVTETLGANFTNDIIAHHAMDIVGTSRVLLEGDLLLAFTRISPSALRSVYLFCIVSYIWGIGSPCMILLPCYLVSLPLCLSSTILEFLGVLFLSLLYSSAAFLYFPFA